MIEIRSHSVYANTDEEAAAVQMAVPMLVYATTQMNYRYRLALPNYQFLAGEQKEILHAVARLYNENP